MVFIIAILNHYSEKLSCVNPDGLKNNNFWQIYFDFRIKTVFLSELIFCVQIINLDFCLYRNCLDKIKIH